MVPCAHASYLAEEAAAAGRGSAAGATDTASLSSGIPAAYEPSRHAGGDNNSHRRSTAEATVTDTPSTSYPVSYADEWDALGACMTTAAEMEACVDAVVSNAAAPASAELDCLRKFHLSCHFEGATPTSLHPWTWLDLHVKAKQLLHLLQHRSLQYAAYIPQPSCPRAMGGVPICMPHLAAGLHLLLHQLQPCCLAA